MRGWSWALLGALVGCRTAGKDLDVSADTGAIGVVDADGDGFASDEDCDDGDASRSPAAIEVCDEIDNDCDGEVDEDVTDRFYADADGDGYGDPDVIIEACDQPRGTVLSGTDCDDGDERVFPSANELCNGIDDNCDGVVDEGLLEAWYTDADGDGYGDPTLSEQRCDAPTGMVQDDTDCDDSTAAAYPGAVEVCDEIDNDCDEAVDEDVTLTFWADGDGDGYGVDGLTTEACVLPAGYADAAGDCDDGDAAVYPWADELCNGWDDDCDGVTDEDDALDAATWYRDADTDGWGVSTTTTLACAQPAGYAPVTAQTDCDDGEPTTFPGADEYCDGHDDDCDGTIDEDDAVDATTWWLDADSDGYGGTSASLTQCSQPTRYVANTSDCDDLEADAFPGNAEVCDGIDNDCDSLVDDDDSGVSGQDTWYYDGDGDGYGLATAATTACVEPSDHTDVAGDCDDGDADINPVASERCNGLDDDCDSLIDEGVLGTSSSCPAEDCSEILADDPTAASGTYYLDLGSTVGAYTCDMVTDNGGWTLIGSAVAVWGTSYDTSYYNSEGFTWDEALFAYNSGSVHAHCTYPGSMTGCNNLGFQFGGQAWGVAQNWGSSLCGMSTTSYTGATSYIGGYDFIISRSSSSSTIRLGTLEGIAGCTTGDNPGTAYVDILIRR